jgi:hypothetical protein
MTCHVGLSLLERVRLAGGELSPVGEAHIRMRAPEPLPDHLIAAVRMHKREILAALQRAATDRHAALVQLHLRITEAGCWSELECILADAQMRFVDGTLPGELVESIAESCSVRSREIPEYANA